MPSRTFLALASWTAAAVAATLTGLAAVEIIGDGITGSPDGTVLTSEQVERQLGAARAAPSPAPGTGTPPPTAPAASAPAEAARAKKTFSGPGGTAIAACDGTTVRLLSWAPAQDYGVKSADRGPDGEHVEVRFEGAAGRAELRVRCVDGEPAGVWKQDG